MFYLLEDSFSGNLYVLLPDGTIELRANGTYPLHNDRLKTELSITSVLADLWFKVWFFSVNSLLTGWPFR